MLDRLLATGRPFAARLRRAALLAAILACSAARIAEAQRLPITLYSTREGLPHYVVNRIVADSRGFLWFCTREGLARYDGRDFVAFGTEEGLPGATVNAIVETRDGTYWIGTTAGLARFDPGRHPHFTTVGGPHPGVSTGRPLNVAALALDPSGDVWVGATTGLYRARPGASADTEVTPVDLDAPETLHARGVAALLVDRDGALWVAMGNRLFRRAASGAVQRLGNAEELPVGSVTDMLEDRTGRVWLATWTGLYRADTGPGGTRRISVALDDVHGLPSPLVSSLLQDSRGSLWAGTNAGLVEIRLDRDGSVAGTRVVAEEEGLPAIEIQGLAEDTHGNVWVGVTPFGAAKLSSTGFESFGLSAPRTFPSTLLETDDGRLVVLGAAAGRWAVNRFDRERFAPVAGGRPDGEPSWGWNQMALQDRSRSWWFGTNQGLLRYPPGVGLDRLSRAKPLARYSRANGLPADVVLRLFEDARGDIWVSTVGHGVRPNGLSVWRPATTPAFVHFTERDGLPPLDRFYASSFAADGRGHVWIGFSGDAGLVRYDGQRFERFTARDGVPPGQIRNLLLDSRGRLWAATYRSGLCRIDQPEAARPQFSAFTTADGLSSNETHAVVEASNGDLYVGTARGIDRLAADTGRWTHFTSHDGLPPGEMQGAFRDRHGALWFTYSQAVLRLLPTPERPVAPPRTFINGVSVAGRDYPVPATSAPTTHRIIVPSGATFRIEFGAPWFGAPGDLTYQYRLEGVDPDWIGAAQARSVSYAGIAPGSYTLGIRALATGLASPEVVTVSFTVVPPLWRRPAFLLPLAVAAALLGYAAYQLRLRRALELANMRTRIATDLHDDIGADLTRIGILTEVVRHHIGAGHAEDSRLASIARLARDSVGAMSDIVWAINPERDSLVDLARKIRDVAEDLAAGSGLDLDLGLPGAASNTRLDMDVRRDLLLICKETLNNAVRHARARRLCLSLREDGGRLSLDMTDDGIGFDADQGFEGNGLVSMRRRAERIGASLSVRSQPGRGTTVRVELPLRRRARSRRAPTPRGR